MSDDAGDGDEFDHLSVLLRALVREGMARRGWTQYRLAQLSKVSEKHLSQLLNGKTVGSVHVWDRLLKAVREEDEG